MDPLNTFALLASGDRSNENVFRLLPNIVPNTSNPPPQQWQAVSPEPFNSNRSLRFNNSTILLSLICAAESSTLFIAPTSTRTTNRADAATPARARQESTSQGNDWMSPQQQQNLYSTPIQPRPSLFIPNHYQETPSSSLGILAATATACDEPVLRNDNKNDQSLYLSQRTSVSQENADSPDVEPLRIFDETLPAQKPLQQAPNDTTLDGRTCPPKTDVVTHSRSKRRKQNSKKIERKVAQALLSLSSIPNKKESPGCDGSETPILVRQRIRSPNESNKTQRGWSTISCPWKVLHYRPESETSNTVNNPIAISLLRGGSLRIWVQLLDKSRRKRLQQEMREKVQFRQYKVQGNGEPRLHALYHAQASYRSNRRDSDDQVEHPSDSLEDPKWDMPGYGYARLRMKARPLQELPEVSQLAQDLTEECNVKDWDIGVNPICYRDGHDSMGMHADDDQGEKVIMTTMIDSPPEARVIRIATKKALLGGADGIPDEQIEIILKPGDAYEMDGEMQKHYVHGVPKDHQQVGGQNGGNQRMVIVFRAGTGKIRMVSNDMGKSIRSLSPQLVHKIPYVFGPLPGFKYGDVYFRRDMRRLRGHSASQRGISGRIEIGADAIIVSSKRLDQLGDDHFGYLLYAAEYCVGAGCLVESAKTNQWIRVYRTQEQQGNGSQRYRYHGLYQIVGYGSPQYLKEKKIVLFVLRMSNWDSQKETNDDISAEEYRSRSKIATCDDSPNFCLSHLVQEIPNPEANAKSEKDCLKLQYKLNLKYLERLDRQAGQNIPLSDPDPIPFPQRRPRVYKKSTEKKTSRPKAKRSVSLPKDPSDVRHRKRCKLKHKHFISTPFTKLPFAMPEDEGILSNVHYQTGRHLLVFPDSEYDNVRCFQCAFCGSTRRFETPKTTGQSMHHLRNHILECSKTPDSTKHEIKVALAARTKGTLSFIDFAGRFWKDGLFKEEEAVEPEKDNTSFSVSKKQEEVIPTTYPTPNEDSGIPQAEQGCEMLECPEPSNSIDPSGPFKEEATEVENVDTTSSASKEQDKVVATTDSAPKETSTTSQKDNVVATTDSAPKEDSTVCQKEKGCEMFESREPSPESMGQREDQPNFVIEPSSSLLPSSCVPIDQSCTPFVAENHAIETDSVKETTKRRKRSIKALANPERQSPNTRARTKFSQSIVTRKKYRELKVQDDACDIYGFWDLD